MITEETRDLIKKEMENYDDFNLYMAEAGWQEWMNNYTEAPDGVECSEAEIKQIEKVQKEIWESVKGV